jgi:hypothetical protein
MRAAQMHIKDQAFASSHAAASIAHARAYWSGE